MNDAHVSSEKGRLWTGLGGGGGETETDRQRRTVRQRHDDIISLEKSRQRSGPDKTEMPFNDETVSRYTGFFTSVLLS